MAETTADVRRDIEVTRERMSDTIAQLERKLNVAEVIRDHPWSAIALAAGAGLLLSGSQSDVKAAAATAGAAALASNRVSRVGPALDGVVSKLVAGLREVLDERADELVGELQRALGGTGSPGRPRRTSTHEAAPVPGGEWSPHAETGASAGSAFGGESREVDSSAGAAAAGLPRRAD